MKFREIFRFELAYQLGRVPIWFCFSFLFLFAIWMMVVPDLSADIHHNAPFSIAFLIVLGGVIWLMIAPSVAGEAATRDVQTKMHPLTYTSPINKFEYLGGRLLAAFSLNSLILLTLPVGILLALGLFDFDPSRLGPSRPATYLTAYGILILPLAFVATAIQFSLATLSHRPMTSYLASVLLIVTSTFASWHLANLLGQWELVTLFDLVGIGGIIRIADDTWTAAEMNNRLIWLEKMVLGNRLIWLSIAAIVLAYTYYRFQFAHTVLRTQWRRIYRRKQPTMVSVVRNRESNPISLHQVQQRFGFATDIHQSIRVAWASFVSIAKSKSGLVLLVVIPVIVMMAISGNMEHLGVPLIPSTAYVLTFLTSSITNPFTPWVIIPLLIILYAGDIVWRERDAGLSEITDAAPVSGWVLLLGKFLGLSLVLILFMTFIMASAILSQVILSYHDFEIGLYLKVLFGLQLPEYLLFALLALVVQALFNQKYVGLLVILLVYAVIAFGSILGIEHNLLVFGSAPSWSYTDMRGFGPSIEPWLWFKLYWAAWGFLLLVVARLFWVRGRDESFKERLHQALHRFTRTSVWTSVVAFGLIISFGGFIFYNTNVINNYKHDTVSDIIKRAAEYERSYRQYEKIPQPRLTGTKLQVEIYPELRESEIRGSYLLVNKNMVPVDSIHIATVPEVETREIDFNRPSSLVLNDDVLGHQIYMFEEQLQPGDSLEFSFVVKFKSQGFRNNGINTSVVEHGTHFTNRDWLPSIGYDPDREIPNPVQRKAHGLAPRPAITSLSDFDPKELQSGAERVTFEAVIGTNENQIAVAPGLLHQTWTEGERRYFHYSTDEPITNDYSIFSANYEVHEAQWQDDKGSGEAVAIQILHHQGHARNLERMVQSIQASLDYFTEQISPYPYNQVRLVEFPGLGIGMTAEAINNKYMEGFSYLNPGNEPHDLDFVFEVVAHEMAHQWWGLQVTPASVEGAALLTESLAWYSAFRVVEKAYGTAYLRRLLDQMRNSSYIIPQRATAPLLRATGQYLGYRKGPFALYTLSEYIGEDQVNKALRRLVEKHGSGEPPLTTSLDLYRELKSVTSDSLQYLLHDLFEENTFWELEIKQAKAAQDKSGLWQVTLEVQARKFTVDETGVETKIPINDWVEIGVFGTAENGESTDKPIYLEKHRITSEKQTITVTVPSKPARAGIDPYNLLDWKKGDNIESIY